MSDPKNSELTPQEKAHVVKTMEKLAVELLTSRVLAEITNHPISTLAPSPRTPSDIAFELRHMHDEGRLHEFQVVEGPQFTRVSFTYRTSYTGSRGEPHDE